MAVIIALAASFEVTAVTKLVDTDTGITTYISGGHVFTISSDNTPSAKARTTPMSGMTNGLEFGNFSNAKSIESVAYRTFVLDGTDLWVRGYGYPVLTKLSSAVNDFGASLTNVTVLRTDSSVATIKLITPNKNQLVTGSPVVVSEVGAGVTSLCGGIYHQAALTADGNVYVIGSVNTDGRLGLGNTTPVTTWTKVPNLPVVAAISCGDTATALLTNTGDVLVAGAGILGQYTNALNYQSINTSGVNYVSVGNNVLFATKSDGELYTMGWHNLIWNGLNRYNYSGLVKVPNFSGTATAHGSGSHVVVMMSDGYTYSWGQNHMGQLGYSIAPLAETNDPRGLGLISAPASAIETDVAEVEALAPVVTVTTENINSVVAVTDTWVDPTTQLVTVVNSGNMTTTTTDIVTGVYTTAPVVSTTGTSPVVTITTAEECVAHNNGQNKHGNKIDYCKKGYIMRNQ